MAFTSTQAQRETQFTYTLLLDLLSASNDPNQIKEKIVSSQASWKKLQQSQCDIEEQTSRVRGVTADMLTYSCLEKQAKARTQELARFVDLALELNPRR